jgi:hypothetical protein
MCDMRSLYFIIASGNVAGYGGAVLGFLIVAIVLFRNNNKLHCSRPRRNETLSPSPSFLSKWFAASSRDHSDETTPFLAVNSARAPSSVSSIISNDYSDIDYYKVNTTRSLLAAGNEHGMALNPAVHPVSRYLIPLIIFATMGTFISSNTSYAATVEIGTDNYSIISYCSLCACRQIPFNSCSSP